MLTEQLVSIEMVAEASLEIGEFSSSVQAEIAFGNEMLQFKGVYPDFCIQSRVPKCELEDIVALYNPLLGGIWSYFTISGVYEPNVKHRQQRSQLFWYYRG
jgi:hypothetical protein